MSHCASLSLSLSLYLPPENITTFLPLSIPHPLFLSHSFTFILLLCLSSSSPTLSVYLCLLLLRLSPSVVSAAVLNRGLFVHKHALSWPLPYLLVSRAAVALLCVIAQPCLFSLPRSCLSWLWTSFKACPVSAPRQTLTHAHTHTQTQWRDVYTLLLKWYLQAKEYTRYPCGLGTNAHKKSAFTHNHYHCLSLSGCIYMDSVVVVVVEKKKL